MRPEAVCVNSSTDVDFDNVDSDNGNCVVTGEVLTSLLHEDEQVRTDLLASVFTEVLWLQYLILPVDCQPHHTRRSVSSMLCCIRATLCSTHDD